MGLDCREGGLSIILYRHLAGTDAEAPGTAGMAELNRRYRRLGWLECTNEGWRDTPWAAGLGQTSWTTGPTDTMDGLAGTDAEHGLLGKL